MECVSDLTLADLAVGQRGFVVDVEGERLACMELLDMGFVPGSLVEISGAAPLGDPVEVTVRRSLITLRSAEARLIRVAAVPSGCEDVHASGFSAVCAGCTVACPSRKR